MTAMPIAFVVLTVGTAGAQDYVAVSTGFAFVFGVHVGFAELLAPDVDLRINLWGTALAASGAVLFGQRRAWTSSRTPSTRKHPAGVRMGGPVPAWRCPGRRAAAASTRASRPTSLASRGSRST
jgi:hypothetical protein